MSNNKKLESPKFLGNDIRLPASQPALGKDAQIAARKWIEEAQEKASFAGLIRILESGGANKSVSILVGNLREA